MSENQRFFDVFRGYRNVTMDQYGLKEAGMKVSIPLFPIFWNNSTKKALSLAGVLYLVTFVKMGLKKDICFHLIPSKLIKKFLAAK